MLEQTISLQTPQSTEAPVSIELGAARLDEDSVAQLETGSLVTLDRHADAPVDIVVEGRVVARGALLVIEEELAVRIVELI